MAAHPLLSPFELLPPELRHLIYTHLNLPVSKNLSLSRIHAYPAPSQNPCPGWHSGPLRLIGLRFTHASPLETLPILARASGEIVSIPEVCAQEGCASPLLERKKWMVFDRAGMRLNRRLYAEISALLYGRLTVHFDFELSEYAVHAQKESR